jgi:hypothetical protein
MLAQSLSRLAAFKRSMSAFCSATAIGQKLRDLYDASSDLPHHVLTILMQLNCGSTVLRPDASFAATGAPGVRALMQETGGSNMRPRRCSAPWHPLISLARSASMAPGLKAGWREMLWRFRLRGPDR